MSQVPTIIDAETTANPQAVWALSRLLLASWAGGVGLHTNWLTRIAAGKSLAETRSALMQRPARLLEVTLDACGPDAVSDLRGLMSRGAMARSLVPVYPDACWVTAAALAVDTHLTVDDTTERRLYAGCLVAIALAGPVPQTGGFAVRTVVSVDSATQITIDSGLGFAVAAGSQVYPLMVCELTPDSSGHATTDQFATANLSLAEVPGPWALPAAATPGELPGGYATYGGYPIFDPAQGLAWNNGQEFSVTRPGAQASAIGLGQYVQVYGDRGSVGYTLNFLALSRADCYELQTFFDSRGGRAWPFWVLSPLVDYRLLAVGASTLQVAAVGPLVDWQQRPYMGLRLADGSVVIRKITGTARAADVDTLTLDAALTGITVGMVAQCMPAHLARFDTEELVLEYSTDATATAALAVRELQAEDALSLANLAHLATGDAALAALDLGGRLLGGGGAGWTGPNDDPARVHVTHADWGSYLAEPDPVLGNESLVGTNAPAAYDWSFIATAWVPPVDKTVRTTISYDPTHGWFVLSIRWGPKGTPPESLPNLWWEGTLTSTHSALGTYSRTDGNAMTAGINCTVTAA